VSKSKSKRWGEKNLKSKGKVCINDATEQKKPFQQKKKGEKLLILAMENINQRKSKKRYLEKKKKGEMEKCYQCLDSVSKTRE